MNNARGSAALLVVAFVAVGSVLAEDTVEAPVPSIEAAKVDFVALDRNLDGRITQDEAAVIAELASAFAQLDVDGDQALTPEEYSRWERAGDLTVKLPDPGTAPGGSAGAQHVPRQ